MYETVSPSFSPCYCTPGASRHWSSPVHGERIETRIGVAGGYDGRERREAGHELENPVVMTHGSNTVICRNVDHKYCGLAVKQFNSPSESLTAPEAML